MTKTAALDQRIITCLFITACLAVTLGGLRTVLAQDLAPAAAMDSMTISASSTTASERLAGEIETAVSTVQQTDVSFDAQGRVQIKLPPMVSGDMLFERPAVKALEDGGIVIDGVVYMPTAERLNASSIRMQVFESADEQIVIYNASRDILLTLDGAVDASGKRVG